MHKLAQSVFRYIQKNDLLRPGDRAGIAVSGGTDSVALLRLLLEIRQETGIVIAVVHLNHKLRGAESDADERFVRELAAAHGLEFICESHDVKAHATRKKLSLEAAARDVRYEFFHELLRERQVDKIATAHTLDDQAETVLLKLARGAGTRGLAGIYPRLELGSQPPAIGKKQTPQNLNLSTSGGWIVRPLLETSRKKLQTYLGEKGQTWREDASNRDLRHTRNRVRYGILPRLERHVNPAVRETLMETAEIARAEEAYWIEEVSRLLPQMWQRKMWQRKMWQRTDTGGILNATRLNQAGLALRRRLARAAAESLGLSLEFRHVEEILELEGDGGVNLAQGWSVTREKNNISFHQSPMETEDREYNYDLPVPGKVCIAEADLVIEAKLFESVKGEGGTSQAYNPQQLLNRKFVEPGLIVRNWRAGERFWPQHSKAPKKIKELLQDRHITGDQKKRWPVVASGDEVVWVRGLGVGKKFRETTGIGILICEVNLTSTF